jgi:small subunit ribosomal protein S6
MRDYELVLIVSPEIGEEKVKKTIESVKKLIASLKGKVVKTTDWGKKELAYPIRKLNQGSYFLLVLNFPADSLQELAKKLKLEENIIRYLIIALKRKKR